MSSSSGVNVALNMAGVREILKSSSMQSALLDAAQNIANNANDMQQVVEALKVPAYRAGVHVGPHTAVSRVFTASLIGRIDEHENKTLDHLVP